MVQDLWLDDSIDSYIMAGKFAVKANEKYVTKSCGNEDRKLIGFLAW